MYSELNQERCDAAYVRYSLVEAIIAQRSTFVRSAIDHPVQCVRILYPAESARQAASIVSATSAPVLIARRFFVKGATIIKTRASASDVVVEGVKGNTVVHVDSCSIATHAKSFSVPSAVPSMTGRFAGNAARL